MTKEAFWGKVAEKWTTKSDGIEIPEIGTVEVTEIDDEETDAINDEIGDILADLGLD